MEHLNEVLLVILIPLSEFIGIFIIAQSVIHGFLHYLSDTFLHGRHDLQFELAEGLATALEFKMAAEILKTVLVRHLEDLLVLGAVITLRAVLSLLIHFELKASKRP